MIVRLNAILRKIEIFVLFDFFFSFVNKKSYFDDAISLLRLIQKDDHKKPYVLLTIMPPIIEAL